MELVIEGEVNLYKLEEEIIISNFDQVSDRERGAKLNADYLVKALVTPADIVNAVRKIFQDKANKA